MEMTNMEKGAFLKLFNRGGYVLDFTTPDFNAFTLDSVGVALCQKYNLSKGKSLIAYIDEASDDMYSNCLQTCCVIMRLTIIHLKKKQVKVIY